MLILTSTLIFVLLTHDLYFFIIYNIFKFISIKNRIQINLIFEQLNNFWTKNNFIIRNIYFTIKYIIYIKFVSYALI